MLLSILILTINSRKHLFDELIASLQAQYKGDEVEILYDDSKDCIGCKRNNLLSEACGLFVVFIDDDDEVSPNYIAWILQAIKENPDADCIGIEGTMTTNGGNEEKWKISKDYTWHKDGGIYYRSTNHISPVRREHALRVRFPETNWSEDYDFSKKIKRFLNKEVKIEHPIYHYKYVSKK